MDSTTAVLLIFVSVLVCCHSTVIVSKDGSGNYTTVSEAIMKAPDMSDKPYTIHVRAGTYEEYVTIPAKKTNIKLVGDGPHLTKLVGYQNGSTIGVGNFGNKLLKRRKDQAFQYLFLQSKRWMLYLNRVIL